MKKDFLREVGYFQFKLLINIILVGWGKDSITQASHNQSTYGSNYDQSGGNVSIKHQLITLISATRTLMRSKKI